MTGADTETQDFIQYYTVLINAGLAGRDAYQLTAAEFDQLAPLMTHNTSVSENVKSLDHLLNGVYHPLLVEPDTAGRPGERSEDISLVLVEQSGLMVFPNPFSNEVRFVAPDGTYVTSLMVTDISGKVVFEQEFQSDKSVMWQTSTHADGIFFYRCRLSNGDIAHGKLIQNKRP